MSVTEWKLWVKGLIWPLRWFIILILIRPVIDNFYYLKEISPFLSPLYIAGVLTPVLAIYVAISFPKPNYSRLDTYFNIIMILIGISCVALLIGDAFSLDSLDFSLKFMFLPLVYFFCRRLIRTKKDLHGVLQTFVFSSVFIVGVFSYELLVNPINIQISRGLERYHGSFADVMGYSIYMTVTLLILSYSLMLRNNPVPFKSRLILFIIAVAFSVLILFNIHHTASYIVVGAILFLFLLHNLKTNISFSILGLMIAGAIIYMTGTNTFVKNFLPLVETDIMVYEGEKGDEALLHGRVGRWQTFYEYFSSKGVVTQLFGLPLSFDSPFVYIGKGSHNDFVRTTMLTGYNGLLFYLFLLSSLFFRIIKYPISTQFLGLGLLAILLLYSLTTTPLLYPTLLYVILPFIASLALPRQIMEFNESK